MPFFGIEVKPENPYTHSCNDVKRLRISQATLGIGSATDKSVIQCSIGDNSPVLLCVLVPDETESCRLDLEFDEVEDVVFSVIGPRSVYLSGYYVGSSWEYSDLESYGVDIVNSEPEEEGSFVDTEEEDSFIEPEEEDSFIDDGSQEYSPYSRILDDEAYLEDKRITRMRKLHLNLLYGYDLGRKKEQDDSVDTPVNDVSPDMLVMNDVKDDSKALVNVVDNVNCDETETTKDYSEDSKILEAESVGKRVESERTEVESGDIHQDLLINHNKQDIVEKMETDAYPAKLDSESGPKLKRRRKELEGEGNEGSRPHSEASEGEQAKRDTAKDDVAVTESFSKKKTKTKKKRKNNSKVTATLSSGLVIEELSKGEPDGKVAVPGKKVKVYYTSMMSAGNDLVFDNNDEIPYKFRLGDEEIMEGWSLGIDGMHVGGKRRLTIPPSLCYGNPLEERDSLPPNTCLVYIVKLVRVY